MRGTQEPLLLPSDMDFRVGLPAGLYGPSDGADTPSILNIVKR